MRYSCATDSAKLGPLPAGTSHIGSCSHRGGLLTMVRYTSSSLAAVAASTQTAWPGMVCSLNVSNPVFSRSVCGMAPLPV